MLKQAFIEAQLKGTGLFEDEDTKQRLEKETGYNWKMPSKEYPFDTISAISNFIIQIYLKDGKTLEEAIYQIGCDVAVGFKETIIGRVAFSATHLMKPQKLIDRILESFSTMTNYGSRSSEQISFNHLRITMKDEPAHPLWLKGVFTTSLIPINLTNLKLEVKTTGFEQVQIDIKWD
jgi:uncharacterized protein (TIGR02265 family)